MSNQTHRNRWFGAMVAAYGVRSAAPEDKAEAVSEWRRRVLHALGRGESETPAGDERRAA